MEKINISPHISWNEAIKSSNAERAGIKNEPTIFQLRNMQMVAHKCFEPFRKAYGKPAYISSFLRSGALNEITPGASETSQHLQGLFTEMEEGALDIDMDVYNNGWTNAQLFFWMWDNLPEFDQLIWEYTKDGEEDCCWVHVSYRKGANRRMVMRKEKGSNYQIVERDEF